MKAEANERGTVEQGFQRAEDGWHEVKFLEGIELLMKGTGDEQTQAYNKQGDQLWKFTLEVDDDTDPSHEVEIDVICAENAKGEQMVCDFLGATGLFKSFAKKFNGDESVFDKEVMSKVKTKLPGQMMRIKTAQNEYVDGKGNDQIAVNLVGFGKMSDDVDGLEKDLFGGASGEKETKKEAAPVEDDDPF